MTREILTINLTPRLFVNPLFLPLTTLPGATIGACVWGPWPMAILVRVPLELLEELVESAISKQGNLYRGELAKLIGASKESLEGKTSLYLISLMKLCGLAEASIEQVLKRSKIVNQRGAVTRDISGEDELKGVIDGALEGFQTLISESFKTGGREGLFERPPKKKAG